MKNDLLNKRTLLAKFANFKASILGDIDSGMTQEKLKGKLVYSWNEFCKDDFPLTKMKIQKDGKIGMAFDYEIVREELQGDARDQFDKKYKELSKSLDELNGSLDKFAQEHSDANKRVSNSEKEKLFMTIGVAVLCTLLVATLVLMPIVLSLLSITAIPPVFAALVTSIAAEGIGVNLLSHHMDVNNKTKDTEVQSMKKSFDNLKSNITQNLNTMENYITLGEVVEMNINKGKTAPTRG